MNIFYKATLIDINTCTIQLFTVNGIGKCMLDMTKELLKNIKHVHFVPQYAIYIIETSNLDETLKCLFPIDTIERVL